MNGFWGASLNVTPLSIAGHGHKAISVVSNNVIAGTDVSLGSGYAWHHVSLVFDVDNMKVYGKFDDTDVDIYSDGRHFTVKAGSTVRLKPGESISIQRGMYHSFWAEGGKTLIGEVSMVNDDNADNRFYEPMGRFPQIEEDEEALYLLCNEYPAAKD
jgi:hypothetical protein